MEGREFPARISTRWQTWLGTELGWCSTTSSVAVDSDQPEDPSLWVIDRFVEEVETVREALDLGPVHVWGQSFGGMLAQEYALAYPGSLRTLMLASTICSASFHRRSSRA